MNRLKKQKDFEKIRKRNNMIMGIVMIFLMTASTLGFALMSQNNSQNTNQKLTYNGNEFLKHNGFWNLKNTKLLFQYSPEEIKNVTILGNYSIKDYSDKPLYFVNSARDSELIVNNLQGIISRFQEACITNCSENLPIKNCEENNIIIFTDSEGDKVWKENNCVYISRDYVKGVDAFNYRLFNLR